MRDCPGLGVGHRSNDWCLIREGRLDRYREESEMCLQTKGTPKITSSHQKPGQARNGFSPKASGRN